MNRTTKRVEGMRDIMGDEAEVYRYLCEKLLKSNTEREEYEEVILPLVEYADLWDHNEELYTFKDRGDRDLALRPELTSSMVKAAINNNIKLPAKLYSVGPVFRYRKSQLEGRQFNQVGFEQFGRASVWDAIYLLADILCNALALDLRLNDLTLHINILCNQDEMPNYLIDLKKYLEIHRNELSPISQEQIDTNPIRIFNSKDEADQKIMEGAPRCIDYVSAKNRKKYEALLGRVNELLTPVDEYSPEKLRESDRDEDLKYLKYKENYKLVMDFDYYTSVVFKVTSNKLGGLSIAAGGRYDNLFKDISGGKMNIPAAGFAIEIDKLLMALGWLRI